MNAEDFLLKAEQALEKTNNRVALKYYLQAARLGNAEGHLRSGLLFLKHVSPQNWLASVWDSLRERSLSTSNEAKHHFIKALEASHPTAFMEFQNAINNKSVTTNPFSSHDPNALFLHALKIQQAEGHLAAWEFFVKAADLGHTESQFKVAKSAQTSLASIPTLLNQLDNPFALHVAFWLYDDKTVVHQDTNLAEKYYTMAADNGHFEAQLCLIELLVDNRKRDLDGLKSDFYFRLMKGNYNNLDNALKSRLFEFAKKQKEFFENIRNEEKAQFYSVLVEHLAPEMMAILATEMMNIFAQNEPSKQIVDEGSTLEKSKKVALDGDSLSDTASHQNIDAELLKLDSMIGLQDVKERIKEFSNVVKIHALRQAQGLPTEEMSLHLVFSGNPGTGKTTVAQTIGNIYQSLGLLSKGHVVRASKSKLVGRYLGETLDKTQQKIEEALDGVLFIDEAYSLIADPNHPIDYSNDAITTLVEGMETYRDRLAVVVAGYKSRMPAFLASNPGLPSRFPIEIEFPDYKPSELTQIFQKFASDSQYNIEEKAIPSLQEHFEVIHSIRGENFGNARVVRNLFDDVRKRQSARILREGLTDRESLSQIKFDDLGL